MAVVRQEILEQLVGGGADHVDGAFFPGPLPVDRGLDRRDRFEGGGAARVTGAVIVVGDVVGVEGRVLRQLFVVRQVLGVEAGAVAQGVGGHHDLVAVQRAPEAELEGDLAVHAGQVAAPPLQFLRGEADQAAVGGDGGQMEPEPEAVGEEDVRADGAELLLVEALPHQDVARERFRGGNVRVGRLPAAAGDVPAARRDGFAQALEVFRIVLLHPGVLDARLAVEHVVGILADQREVAEERLGDVLRDGGLHVPVPLGIQVRVGDKVGFRSVVLGAGAEGGQGQKQSESGFEQLGHR